MKHTLAYCILFRMQDLHMYILDISMKIPISYFPKTYSMQKTSKLIPSNIGSKSNGALRWMMLKGVLIALDLALLIFLAILSISISIYFPVNPASKIWTFFLSNTALYLLLIGTENATLNLLKHSFTMCMLVSPNLKYVGVIDLVSKDLNHFGVIHEPLLLDSHVQIKLWKSLKLIFFLENSFNKDKSVGL